MNRRGQALIEFVLILPVFLFIVFAVYDIGMIFSKQNKLENDSTDIVLMYKDGKTIDEIENMYKDIDINTVMETDYEKIILKEDVKLITPGFNLIFGNPYKIEVMRFIRNE